ncbi:hypothetical protein QR680_003535 [Steinernema hermaphroditum]|uniref:Uncharacterized protein n=1 Tax=Steinernema hermaphroditum TaxID=289476 RepID=A0AA39HKQ9_9BILA|nr:hypothetical protein QR680_003535 [Steinernema hermaphroditum]
MGYFYGEHRPYPYRHVIGPLYIIFSICPILLHILIVRVFLVHPKFKNQYSYRIMAFLSVFEGVMQVSQMVYGIFLLCQNTFHVVFENFITTLSDFCWYGIFMHIALLAFNRCVVLCGFRNLRILYKLISGVIWLFCFSHLIICQSSLVTYRFWLDLGIKTVSSGVLAQFTDNLKFYVTLMLLGLSFCFYLFTVLYLIYKRRKMLTMTKKVISKHELRILLQACATFFIGLLNEGISYKAQVIFGLQSVPFIASVLLAQCNFGLLNPVLYLIINRELRNCMLQFWRPRTKVPHIQVQYKSSSKMVTKQF